MTPERWQEIELVFSGAFELEGGERDRFVVEHCTGDPELQREVEALLASLASAGEYFEELAGRIGVPTDPETHTERLVGKRIGNYRLVDLIGRGGMGAVYLAERDDEQFQMKAALKLLPMGLDSDESRRRFLAERQILARLEHPNIARLVDGGVTEDSTPYFVMEHVEGTAIDEYCDTHELTIQQRLALFLKVCDAVQHAHQNLVVHRDLKPSNILVTESGEVKLLDFGIARVLDSDGSGAQTTLTRRARPMTIAYASPEQILGSSVTTVSDVYALGVLLYTLLTGRHPYELSSKSLMEVEQIICEQEPERPSGAVFRTEPSTPEDVGRHRGTTPQRLRRDLVGDLDTIILTALRKEPERRYASVSHFADDLRRYETGLPVTAHKDTLGYRTSRFVRRHKVGVTAVAAIAVLLTGLGVVSFRFALTTAAQSREIAREAETAEQVSSFLIDLFEVTNPGQGIGDTVTARTILDRGVESIEASLAGQPAVQARLMLVLGRVYQNLGLLTEAWELEDNALTVMRELHPSDHVDLANAIENVADIQAENRYMEMADTLYREALEMRRRLDDEPLKIATTLESYATILRNLNNVDSAETLINEALALRRRFQPWAHLDVTNSLSRLAFVLRAKGDLDSAEALYEMVVDRYRAQGDTSSWLVQTLNNLGYLYRVKEDYAEAERVYREALAVNQQHGTAQDRILLLANLASVLNLQGKHGEVHDVLQERLEVVRKNWPAGHWRVGEAVSTIGGYFIRLGDSILSEPYFREGAEIYDAALGRDHAVTGTAWAVLGAVYKAQRRFEDAERLILRGWSAFENREMDQFKQDVLLRLVMLYEAWGKRGAAAKYRALMPADSTGG